MFDRESFKTNALKHSALVKERSPHCKTEEASKTSLILPFFRDVLGYAVDDPKVFVPEYVADIGIKKGEHVDYAILKNGKPEILIEAKWNGYSLDGYVSQLYRYFSTTSAKLGILTNGVQYRFYGDLDNDNLMDKESFREINMQNLTEDDITYLELFHADRFNSETILSTASEVKIAAEVVALLGQLFEDPDNQFTAYILKRLGKNNRSSKNLQPIVKASIDQFIASLQNRKPEPISTARPDDIITTPEEIEAYHIIRTLLHETVPASRIVYKDCRPYFAVLLDSKTTQWICRLYPSKDALWQIHFPTDNPKKPEKVQINSSDDLYSLKDRLIAAVQKYI